VLADTNTVLSCDPGNLKALYRRALALEATGDLDSATRDVEEILRAQPQNELAREARERFREAQQTAAAQCERAPDVVVTPEVDVAKELAKSIALKTQGNEAMKAGKCAAAIDFYTQAISCDASNILFFNNRAQAYIKTSQFEKAEADASHVIQHDTDQIPNLKAYFRRALARKGINTEDSLECALDDVSFILSHEPDNKSAIIEKQKIGTLLKSQVDSKRQKQDRLVEEIIAKKEPSTDTSTLSGLTERSSKTKVRSSEAPKALPTPAAAEKSVHRADAPSPPASEKQKTPAATAAAVLATSKTTAAKDISVKNPSVPADPPKTVYEFERIWRGLKNRPDLFAVYLKCFKKSTYKKVLKETCSPDLLSSLLVSVRDHLLMADGNIEKGVSVLEGLASIPKYDMIRFVLPETDLACIHSCLDYVSLHSGQVKADSLREKLKM
jgi:tetratricopeptide (TPR) repeat protein